MSIGTIIKILRLKAKLSASELSRQVGKSRAYVHLLETGAIQRPDGNVIEELAKVLQVPAAKLFKEMDGDETTVYFVDKKRNHRKLVAKGLPLHEVLRRVAGVLK